MTGKLVVFEGLSAAGKNTQVRLLVQRLKTSGKKAVFFSFPNYASPTGQLIAEYLAGKYGVKENLVETAVMLYALDRYQNASKIADALTANDFVILDRYTPANLAFQGALVSENEKKELWDWINAVERHLPKADVMVFLDVPRIHTQTLIQTRSNKNPLTDKDIHESDAEFEERVRQNYVDLAKQKNWVSIDCVSANRLLSPDEIHVLVIKSLRQRDIL